VACPLFLTKLLVRSGLARLLPGVRRLGGGGDFLRYFSDRLLAAPFTEMEHAAELLQVQGPDVIDLAQGSPHFDLAPSGSTKLPADRRGWPPAGGLPELRAAIAEKLLVENCLPVSPPEEILITAGVLGAVQTVVDAFINPGDRVVLFDPTSPLYALALRTRRARIRWLDSWVEDGRTRFRLDRLARALRGAKLIVLNSPANPTGGVLSADDLEQIAWWADRHDVLILSDEVFDRFRHDDEGLSIGTLPKARRRTLTTGGVSKGYALASARVGWLAGHRHLLRPCLATAALRSPFVPTLCQQVALAALRTGTDAFEPVRAEFESRRRYCFERLRAADLNPAWPAGAFFLWVPVWPLGVSGPEFTNGLLREHKVCVTPGDVFGPSGPGYVRLSYAADEGRLQEGLNRIGEYVAELNGDGVPRPLPVAA
jgi:aspartate/methionine/tyrosine aminotransferase